MRSIILVGGVIVIAAAASMAQGNAFPSCLADMKKNPNLAPYVTYLEENNNVEQVLVDYFRISQGSHNSKRIKIFKKCRKGDPLAKLFIDKLEEAAISGLPPTAPLPAAYTPNSGSNRVTITKDERNEIKSADLAQIFYVEVNELVPWRIYNYPKKELEELINYRPSEGHVLNYSPRETWDVVQRNLDMSTIANPDRVLEELFKYGRLFRHAVSVRDPVQNIVTVDEMDTIGGFYQSATNIDRISQSGCHSMVPYIIALAHTLNIPGESLNGYFTGEGHKTAAFSLTNQVFAHGDDPYNVVLRNTPAAIALDSFSRWEADVLAYQPGQGFFSDAGINSRTHNYENYRLYPAKYIMQRFCGNIGAVTGREYLDTFFIDEIRTWATSAELDAMAVKINEVTNNCSFVPNDDPESLT